MTSRSYVLSGLLPIRGQSPGFATPIYRQFNKSQEFIQSFEGDDRISEFIPLTVGDDIRIRDVYPVSRQIGDPGHFAFVTPEGNVIVAERDDLTAMANELDGKLERYPFIRRQLRRFCGADALPIYHTPHEIEAMHTRASPKERSSFRERLRNIGKASEIEGSFFHLFPSYSIFNNLPLIEEIFHKETSSEESQVLAWSKKISWRNLSHHDNSYLTSWEAVWIGLKCSYYYRAGIPKPFCAPNTPTLTLFSDLDDINRYTGERVLSHIQTGVIKEDMRLNYQALQVGIKGRFLDLTDLHGLVQSPEDSSWLGQYAVAQNYNGLIYRAPQGKGLEIQLYALEDVKVEGAGIVEMKVDHDGVLQLLQYA